LLEYRQQLAEMEAGIGRIGRACHGRHAGSFGYCSQNAIGTEFYTLAPWGWSPYAVCSWPTLRTGQTSKRGFTR
jgi:hypothetical protein